MKNLHCTRLPMGRVCKRGHSVTGNNAIPKRIAGRTYHQCRECRNLAEVSRRKFLRERYTNENQYRHIVINAV